MIKLYIRIITLIIPLFSLMHINAQQYMGSEITWECTPSGQADAGKYIFQLKLYGNCAYAAFSSTPTLYSNSPAGNIALTMKNGWPKDISPVCNSDTNFTHITCAGATTSNNLGAVKEYIYRSQPVQLNGTPPASGWLFYHGNCCRYPSTNIAGIGSYRARAVMYPYGTQNMYPCFDNSPTLAAEPQMFICQGYPTTINCFGFDKELDSLVYEWGQPQLSNGYNLPIQYPYTYQSPFPGPSINPNNVAASMDSKTGAISFTSHTGGLFTYVVKVTAYKASIKVAEIFKEVNLALYNCSPGTKPNISIKRNSVTIVTDSLFVQAGDSIDFSIQGTDFQLLPNGTAKTLELSTYSKNFGAFNPNSTPPTFHTQYGCINPPCAILTPAPHPTVPLTGQTGVQTRFQWKTDCGHLKTNAGSNLTTNEYRFTFMVKNDYCPVPSYNTRDIIITVLPAILPKPVLSNIKYNYTNFAVEIDWQLYHDPDSNFIAYDLFHSNYLSGPYMVLDTIDDINQTSYSHSSAMVTQGYYFINVRSNACTFTGKSENSDTIYINTIGITNPENTIPKFQLYQNEPNPAQQHTLIRYSIDRKLTGNFRLIDITGQIIIERDLESNIGNNEIKLDLNTLRNGIYYYQIEFNNMRKVKKLIILK